jgi:hypothetical protein
MRFNVRNPMNFEGKIQHLCASRLPESVSAAMTYYTYKPNTMEAETWRIEVQDQPRQIIPHLQNNQSKRNWRIGSSGSEGVAGRHIGF